MNYLCNFNFDHMLAGTAELFTAVQNILVCSSIPNDFHSESCSFICLLKGILRTRICEGVSGFYSIY